MRNYRIASNPVKFFYNECKVSLHFYGMSKSVLSYKSVN